MLYAKDCAHLTTDDWAGIAAKIINLKKGEHLLVAKSDEHEGGVTSCMPEAEPAVSGFSRLADILLLGGDDYEFESILKFITSMKEFQKKYSGLSKTEFHKALCKEAEIILRQKVVEDKKSLEKTILENRDRQIVKIIGNHENFETFREALTKLEGKYPNFQWTSELALIPMPGGKKSERDRLLATHGDLQMDDLWFVEDGGTDRERKCLSHEQMAEKVVSIATKPWAPSAQKQEKGQGIVNWWRKPRATAKTLFAELLFRAQEGDFHQAVKKTELDAADLAITEERLKKRKEKFESFAKELEKSTDLAPEQKEAEALVYTRAIERIDQKLEKIEAYERELGKKSSAFHARKFKSPETILHYKKLGEPECKLFTSKTLERVTHINYGHTHVSAEGVDIKGLGGETVTVSNNASVTGAIMRQPLDEKGKHITLPKGQQPLTDLGNLGVLLYRVKDGKITEITSIGHLLAKNINQVRELIRDIPKPQRTEQTEPPVADTSSKAFATKAIRKKAAGERESPGG